MIDKSAATGNNNSLKTGDGELVQQVIQTVFFLDIGPAQIGGQVFQKPGALGVQFGVILEMDQKLFVKRSGIDGVALNEFIAQPGKIVL